MAERYLRHKVSGIITRYSEVLAKTNSYIEIGEPEFERSDGLATSAKKPIKPKSRKQAAAPTVAVTDDELSTDELDRLLGDGADA